MDGDAGVGTFAMKRSVDDVDWLRLIHSDGGGLLQKFGPYFLARIELLVKSNKPEQSFCVASTNGHVRHSPSDFPRVAIEKLSAVLRFHVVCEHWCI